MSLEPNQIQALATAQADVIAAQAAADAAQADADSAQSTASSALARVPAFPFLMGAVTPSANWQITDGYLESASDIRLSVSSDTLAGTTPDWDGVCNVANFQSGPNTIASSNRIELPHKASTGTTSATAPGVYRSGIVYRAGVRIAAYIGAVDLDEINQGVYLVLNQESSQSNMVRVGLRRTTGPLTGLESRGTGAAGAAVVFADELPLTGLWVMIELIDLRHARTYYNTTAGADANPWAIAWTAHASLLFSGDVISSSESTICVGAVVETGASASLGAFTGWLKSLSVRYLSGSQEAQWGIQKRPTTAAPHAFGEADLGSASAVLSDAAARAQAESMTNRRPWGSATVEWRYTRSATSPVTGSGSWYSADAIEVQGTGRYLLPEVRYTSDDGIKTASVQLNVPLITGT